MSNTHVIGLTGYAQSGKDTAAGFLEEFGYKRYAFADILRQSLYNLNPIVTTWCSMDSGLGSGGPDEVIRVRDLVDDSGWDVVKVRYPEIRGLLQRMGTEVGRTLYGENFWVSRVIESILLDSEHHKFVITDVRFANEASAVHDLKGHMFRITRPGTGAVNAHISDTGVDALPIDAIIRNTGDLATFRQNVLNAAGIHHG